MHVSVYLCTSVCMLYVCMNAAYACVYVCLHVSMHTCSEIPCLRLAVVPLRPVHMLATFLISTTEFLVEKVFYNAI